jgi:hypothetical protein
MVAWFWCMKATMRIPIGIAIALVASMVPMSMAMPPPQCMNGVDDDGDGLADYPYDPGCNSPWDNSEEDVIIICKLQHTSPHSHTYGFGGSAGARSDTVTGGDEVGAGVVTVFETNTADCDQDGIAGDYDGDWETGIGGGFFGYGPWANEATCNYGLTIHGGTATVSDVVFGSDIAFVIGADDTSGPVVTVDPVTGEVTCETSGSITPGDPATDPTADADDCLTDVYTGSGTTCGAGGDGGYWVFLSGALVSEGSGGAGVSNAPTAGTITA